MSFLRINERVIMRTTEILAIDIDDRAAWIRVKDQPREAPCISVGEEWGKTPSERAVSLARAIGTKETLEHP